MNTPKALPPREPQPPLSVAYRLARQSRDRHVDETERLNADAHRAELDDSSTEYIRISLRHRADCSREVSEEFNAILDQLNRHYEGATR